jgi:flagellin
MALVITNNVQSLTAQHNLTRTSEALGKSLERLSSGLKINRGADGPAALVISEKQRAQIAGLKQAIENSSKAVTLVQTAEGALTEINSLLTKVRSLALDSANEGVNDSKAQAANQAEIANALDTINRIASNTQFGTKKLLDGTLAQSTINDTHLASFGATNIAAGTYDVTVSNAGAKATRAAGAYSATVGGYADLDTGVAALTDAADAASLLNTSTLATDVTLSLENSGTVQSVNVAAGATIGVAVASLNSALTSAGSGYTVSINASGQIAINASDNGTYANEASVKIAETATPANFIQTNTTASGVNVAISSFGGQSFSVAGNRGQTLTGSLGATVTLASTATATTYSNALTVTNGAMFQIGPNQNQTVAVNIASMRTTAIGLGVAANQFADLASINVTTAAKAQDAVGVIDQAIDDVSTLRAELGAFQKNTLESGTNNLRATLENTTQAESVIRDTDFSQEIASFTKSQVLQQAGLSVLANANQLPQMILSLLGK